MALGIASSQLQRLAENTMYHYDAAYFYEGVASGEIIIPEWPEEPEEEIPPIEVLMSRAREARENGNGEPKAAPPVPSLRFTDEEIIELNEMSNIHLSAAIQLDEVIGTISQTEEGQEAIAALERAMPKRNAVSVLRARAETPRGRPPQVHNT